MKGQKEIGMSDTLKNKYFKARNSILQNSRLQTPAINLDLTYYNYGQSRIMNFTAIYFNKIPNEVTKITIKLS
jgi:hypothetical protein